MTEDRRFRSTDSSSAQLLLLLPSAYDPPPPLASHYRQPGGEILRLTLFRHSAYMGGEGVGESG